MIDNVSFLLELGLLNLTLFLEQLHGIIISVRLFLFCLYKPLSWMYKTSWLHIWCLLVRYKSLRLLELLINGRLEGIISFETCSWCLGHWGWSKHETWTCNSCRRSLREWRRSTLKNICWSNLNRRLDWRRRLGLLCWKYMSISFLSRSLLSLRLSYLIISLLWLIYFDLLFLRRLYFLLLHDLLWLLNHFVSCPLLNLFSLSFFDCNRFLLMNGCSFLLKNVIEWFASHNYFSKRCTWLSKDVFLAPAIACPTSSNVAWTGWLHVLTWEEFCLSHNHGFTFALSSFFTHIELKYNNEL